MEAKAPSTALFGWLSFGYLAFAALGAWLLGYFDQGGTPIAPNEWGDVLAGVFSPLAFLWLIYAALSQRVELALQRAELTQNNATQDAQREEMRKQVEALSAQARLLEAQASAAFDPIFVIEQVYSGNRQRIMVELTNHGCDIVDVYFTPEIDIEYKNGNSGGFDNDESRVYVWQTGSRVTVAPVQEPTSELFELNIEFNRKDGQTKTMSYLVDTKRSSLQLVASSTGAGHPDTE